MDEPTASPLGGASVFRENLRRNIALANAISKQQGSQAKPDARPPLYRDPTNYGKR